MKPIKPWEHRSKIPPSAMNIQISSIKMRKVRSELIRIFLGKHLVYISSPRFSVYLGYCLKVGLSDTEKDTIEIYVKDEKGYTNVYSYDEYDLDWITRRLLPFTSQNEAILFTEVYEGDK